MTRIDSALQAHKDWLGFVRPVGLVVSPRALLDAQAHIDVRAAMLPQQALLGLTEGNRLVDFVRFTTDVLGWRESDLASGAEIAVLSVPLPELSDTLTPTYAVRDAEDSSQWLLLVVEAPVGDDLDDESTNALRGWTASHQARFERLLRERDVPIGILTNRECVRLVYAPRGESTGHLTFVVRHMVEVPGRPILAALLMLLGEQRLFALPSNQRLPALLRQSRKYQNEVSERLAEQVLESLWRLLYGFQAADDFSHGELLRDVLRDAPNDVYGGLLATIMRMVFTLYAEDQGLLPMESKIYAENYSLLRLFERLREDNSRFPDTMPERYGAWVQLLTLFRLLHDGASHAGFHLPARHGHLFDPDAYPFLEGRTGSTTDADGEASAIPNVPRISDGIVYGILDKLLYLDGDRLSYAALDVEEIGSVYEAMMGFQIEVTTGRAIAVKPKTKKGVRADVIVDLDDLLTKKPQDRAKLLKENASADVAGKAVEALKSATTPEQIVEALGNRVSPFTPRILPKGAMALQPSEERRRSGSHYTPRAMTQPIVKTTLQPVLDQLCGDSPCPAFNSREDGNRRDPITGCTSIDGEKPKHHHPRPEQILDLKVCDPAMGSGAFLVETCRFLGNALVRSWQIYGGVPAIPPDEDIDRYARRRVAQQCLYGVDRNPFAVDLAKLSLWLATLAKDHPFTFLDHALRHGDSLIGLSRDQIVHFDWEDSDQFVLELSDALKSALAEAEAKRDRIHELSDSDDTSEKQRLLSEAEAATSLVRTAGDLLLAAFFDAEKDRERKALRASTLDALRTAIRNRAPVDDGAARALRSGPKPVPPFHWFLEFPEVFSRSNPGFDAFVGNPPFAGKNTLIHANRDGYTAWLKVLHEETHGNADLIAQFFRRAFTLTRVGGTFGLIATNTIAQGDTRGTGLRWICKHGGTIYEARKRVKWPGAAAVVVSVIHVRKGSSLRRPRLDGREVDRVTAFLFYAGGDDDPLPLRENAGKSFIGSYVLGMGFTFDDDNEDATPVAEMQRLIAKNPKNAERIFPYIGGEEVNDSPTHAHRRYVINFGEMTEREARDGWPDLMEIVERKVKGTRASHSTAEWWHFERSRAELYEAIRGHDKVLVAARNPEHLSFAFLPSRQVFSEQLVVFALSGFPAFGVLQSRVHTVWARFFGSSMKDDPRYTPTKCFEPFPQVAEGKLIRELESLARHYYEHRAGLMESSGMGLTGIYNRFHDPDDRRADIQKLRELHDAMDRAVLDAYDWNDVRIRSEFLLEHEDEEEKEAGTRRKKSWRYRWPDEIRDEILARLLALNAERARREQLLAASATVMSNKTRRRALPKAVPLFELPRITPPTPRDPATLPNGAWARPTKRRDGDEIVLLAAMLREVGQAPSRDIRLAALLASEPGLLTPMLDANDAEEWKRLVGSEAVEQPALDSKAAAAWGNAVRTLRARGRMLESGDTWSAGPGLEAIEAAEWHTGRVAIVAEAIRRLGSQTVVATLPEWARELIDGAAA